MDNGLLRLLALSRNRFRSDRDYRAMQTLIAESTLSELTERGINIKQSHMLELGAGSGGYTQVFDGTALSLVASDIYQADVFTEELSHVAFSYVDVTESFPFADGQFDFIFCSSLVEHLADRATLFQECGRILSPGGTALISFPPFWSLSMVGGHRYKPFHFLGEKLAVKVASRKYDTTILSYDHDYGEGRLYPLTIDALRRELTTNGLHVVDEWARMSPVNTMMWPGLLADLFTWHACFMVSRD